MSDPSILDLTASQIIAEIQAYALQLGIFDDVNAHGPLNPPGPGTTGALWVGRIRPVRKASGLNGVAVLFVMVMRIYVTASAEPLDSLDVVLANATNSTMKALAGGFTLQGLVRNIDLFGDNGVPFDAPFGYADLQGQNYRCSTITIPCVVNDVWEEDE